MLTLEEFEKLSLSEMIDLAWVINSDLKYIGLLCNDKTYLAIRIGVGHSTPDTLEGPYSTVGVTLHRNTPLIWDVYRPKPQRPYWEGTHRYVPIEQIAAFITMRGGLDMEWSYGTYINSGKIYASSRGPDIA